MIISGGELARRANVSRQAVCNLTRDGKLIRSYSPSGKYGYDDESPDIKSYIQNASSQRRSHGRPPASTEAPATTKSRPAVGIGRQQGPYPLTDAGTRQFAGGLNPFGSDPRNGGYGPGGKGGRSDDPDPDSRSGLETRKIKATAEKYELQNRIIRHKYVPIEDARAVFGKIYSVHTGILTPLSAKLSDQLAAEFGVRDPEKVLRGTRILNDELFLALSQIKREIDEFLEKEGERVVTESEELALTLDDGTDE